MANPVIVAGTTATLTFTFTTKAGVLVDPTTVILAYEVANGTVTQSTYNVGVSSIVRASTGVYTWDVDTTGNPGTWKIAAIGIGNGGTVTYEDVLIVTAPTVAVTRP